MKLKHFLWLALRDKIQSCEQLKLKGWVGSKNCLLCDNNETTDHIIFDCPMAIFVWCICRDALGWEACPGGFDDFFRLVGQVSKARLRVMTALLASICWVLWNTRNDMIFRSKIVYSPLHLSFQIVSYLMQWKVLGRADELAILDTLIEKLRMMNTRSGNGRAGIG